jgi:hypothetical protein
MAVKSEKAIYIKTQTGVSFDGYLYSSLAVADLNRNCRRIVSHSPRV